MEVSGHEKPTTNNRMELMGAIKALEVIDPGSYVHLFTDSRYVERGIVYWIRGWIARGWKSREGEPVKNQDLWEKLLEVSNRHFVVWQWVKGHDGDKWNERCDVLATTEAHKCN
jgi:ribonuclease HI